jgi:isopentenyl diphosphate isomerase/L-lactate dehydrogenase-like FMN-dependent dehydrogenase
MTSERGLAGVASLPVEVHRAADYEALARRRLPTAVYEYIAGGSGDGATLAANRAAFERETICPRLLRDVTTGSTHVTVAGCEWTHPIMLAPIAHHALVHPRAEIETARGAAASDAGMVASTLSSCTLEDIAAAAPGPKWFQLYVQPRRADTLDLVRRAEACGYSAIVVTLDAAIQLPSARALEAGFTMPAHCVAANLRGYASPEPVDVVGSRIFAAMRTAPTWADLEWLKKHTSLPVWVKGVLHPDDARQLRDRGVAGLVVSNHGGRTLDHAPASLVVLPSIRTAVGPDHPLLLDSGVRAGADVYKALALGADAVLVGRLQLYALAVAGALGVAHLLRLLREELEVCMAMTGCTLLSELRRDGAGSRDPC